MEYQEIKTSQSKQDVSKKMSKGVNWQKVLEALVMMIGTRVNSTDTQNI
ncbi:MAG: hypothetical protein LKJ88_06370 [Bacilli bacterium]|jgi:hypothetical protein|nr:hypothetical protein [Bacilli bacterium]